MYTSTLIVRLAGLYLLVWCSLSLLQLKKAQAMVGSFGGSPHPLMADLHLYLWFGLIAGMAATLFAGPLARLLTFDAESRDATKDLSDRLLARR